MMSPVTITTTLTNGHELLNGHLEGTVNGLNGKLDSTMLNNKLDSTMLNGKLEPVNGFKKNGLVKPDPTEIPVSYFKSMHQASHS